MNKLSFFIFPLAPVLAASLILSGCSEEQAPPSESAPAPVIESATASTEPVASAAQSPYSAEALESLLAPVALYPDPVLAQVLSSATNPQEVLDAGNWLVANPDLSGQALDSAAAQLGFTPAMMSLVHFPTVVDMMCMEMDWTTELGTAFLEDEPGVLSAVQRLRQQASEMGNLQNSEQLKVTTDTQNNQQIIVVQPANPEVVYVPQYNPSVVYTTPPPATTTTTTTTAAASEEGYSTGALITTGLLSFGAGILVNELFDDDDDDYYYPRWGYGYGGPAYYPPPYRPRYGNGYRPAHGYNRPGNYQHGFNNNNIYVNSDGKKYFNRFEGGRNNYRKKPNSPISAARPNRPELGALNQGFQPAKRPNMPAQVRKPAVQGGYAGGDRPKVAAQRSAGKIKAPTGSYAGANPAVRKKFDEKTLGARDRGRSPDAARSAVRPQSVTKHTKPDRVARPASNRQPGGFQGIRNSGKAERAASQRGRASMPHGAKRSAGKQGNLKRGRKR
jgi:Protein of unknown function (DUF3300)